MWMMLALSSLLTWATIVIASAIGSDTAAAAEGAIERLQRVRTAILTMEQGGSVLLLVLGSAALLFWIWRYRTHHVSGVIQQIRTTQAEALLGKLNEGTLPELPPTETMQKLAGVLEALKTQQVEVEQKACRHPGRGGAAEACFAAWGFPERCARGVPGPRDYRHRSPH